jgi:hypothetical protein
MLGGVAVIGRMVNAEGSVQVYDLTSHQPSGILPANPAGPHAFSISEVRLCLLAGYAFAAVSDTSGTKRKSAFSIAGIAGMVPVCALASRGAAVPSSTSSANGTTQTHRPNVQGLLCVQLSLMLNNLS